MGTWGYKTFENDSASDWLYDLEEAKDEKFLLNALARVKRAKAKADQDDCIEALAASEVIAGARHDPPDGIPAIAKRWIRKVGFSPTNKIIQDAISATQKISKSSELADLWTEGTERNKWRSAIKALETRLTEGLQRPAPDRKKAVVVHRQTLAEFIKEIAQEPGTAKRQQLREKLMKLSDPNRPVGGKGLNSMTPLHWIAQAGFVEEAKILISRGAVVDAEVGCMARPVAFAISAKQYAMVDYLVSAGCDKNYALLSALQENDIRMAEQLSAAGADIGETTETGVTLLHFAASAGAEKSVKWLLDHGADVNATDCGGDTALHLAIESGHLAVVKVLLESGADLKLKNKAGQTALDVAQLEFVSPPIARFVQQYQK